MKRVTAVVALLVAALALVQVATFTFTEEDLELDEASWELYGRWAAHHGVVREPGRFPTFKAKAHRLHGKKTMGLNIFGDRSFDEATISCSKEDTEEHQLPFIDLDTLRARAAAAAERVDWRLAFAVTNVKRQGD